MNKLVRAEWIKFTTVRSTWGTLVAFMALSVGFMLISAFATDVDRLSRAGALDNLLGMLTFTAILLAVVGVLAYGTEYRHDTLASTFVAAPIRNEVTAAKTILYGVIGAIASTATVIVMAIVGVLVLNGRGVDIELTDRIVWERSGQAIAYCVLFILFGVGLGTLIRQSTAAITIMVMLPTVITGFLGILPGAVQKFLPFNAGGVLISGGVDAGSHVSAWEGAAVLGAWAAVVLLIGGWLVNRRDFV